MGIFIIIMDLKYKDEQICFVINQLISPLQCQELINYIDNQATLECEDTDIEYKFYNHLNMRWEKLPNNLQKLSIIIFEKIKNALPKDISYEGHLYTIENVSRDLTFIKYNVGGVFDIHKDYITGGALKKNFFTINIYLNDLHSTDGGQLNLYNDEFQQYQTICPNKGTCVVFDMNTYHDSSKLLKGVKYFMKTWISYKMVL